MKILFLAHLFPLPLDSGGKIKTYYTLKALAKQHEVRVLAFVRSEQEQSLMDDLRQFCARVDIVWLNRGKIRQLSDLALSVAGRRSFIVSRDYRSEMQSAFRKQIDDFKPDVVHIDHLQMAQFVDFHASYATVLDHHNVEHMIIKRIAETSDSRMMRLYARLEWLKLLRYELEVCRNCDLVLTVSDEDKQTIQSLSPAPISMECIPIGVDVDYFRPVAAEAASRNILSIGTMYWPPNVDSMLYFYHEVFPIIRERISGCTLTIAGQRPVQAIQDLGSDPSVTVTGYVDDVRETARDCGVFIVPLRSGSGVRVKILNAMAMGLPVVSTPVGVEGLAVEDGKHVLLGNTPQELAGAVVRVLEDSTLSQSLRANGRQLVCDRYSWEGVGRSLLDMYSERLGGDRFPV